MKYTLWLLTIFLCSCSKFLPEKRLVDDLKEKISSDKIQIINMKKFSEENDYTRIINKINEIYFGKKIIDIGYSRNSYDIVEALPNNIIVIGEGFKKHIFKLDEIKAILCHEVGHLVEDHWGINLRESNSQYLMVENTIKVSTVVHLKEYSIGYTIDSFKCIMGNSNQSSHCTPYPEGVNRYYGEVNAQKFSIEDEKSADKFSISCQSLIGVRDPIGSLENALHSLITKENSWAVAKRLEFLRSLK